jgi:hypothetical protein
MSRITAALLTVLLGTITAFGQTASNGKAAPADNTAFLEIARAALAAHGGDKLRQMRTFVVRGSCDIAPSPSQSIPATFVLVMSGDKYLFELNNPIQPLKQIFDGQRRYSSGYELPPMTSLGFPLLPKIGVNGYLVSGPAEGKKKRKGFRITTPEGYYTDFFVDEKTGQIKSYESAYEIFGRTATTSVEIDEMLVVEGVTVPKKYSQRFDLGPITAYGTFKAKDIQVNQAVPDTMFAIPK